MQRTNENFQKTHLRFTPIFEPPTGLLPRFAFTQFRFHALETWFPPDGAGAYDQERPYRQHQASTAAGKLMEETAEGGAGCQRQRVFTWG